MTGPASLGGGSGSASPLSGLAEAIDSILDKGLVIDAFVRVSLIGIDLLTIEARIVVASVDTYLQFAEAMGRIGQDQTQSSSLLESRRHIRHQTEGAVGATALAASPASAWTTSRSRDGWQQSARASSKSGA